MTNVATTDATVEFEPFRAELTGYCYRMLGSTFDADDAVQATMVRAWRGYQRFEGRSSLRSWLYRIATNVCIDVLHGRARRAVPMDLGPSSPGDSRPGDPSPEIPWIEPVPGGVDPAVSTRANGAPAFGLYKPSSGGGYEAFAIQVVEVSGGRICALHSFLVPRLFGQFGLPARLAE